MKLDIGCQEAARLISDRLDRELPPAERARLRLHLVLCHTCRGVNEQMQFLRRALRVLGGERNDHSGR
jgi:predicted anti-sigma-YlaC factor YlaD